jgi:hypothetical protein
LFPNRRIFSGLGQSNVAPKPEPRRAIAITLPRGYAGGEVQ